MKVSNDIIANRTRDLPACSAVPQPTAPPRATLKSEYIYTFTTTVHLLLLLLLLIRIKGIPGKAFHSMIFSVGKFSEKILRNCPEKFGFRDTNYHHMVRGIIK